MRQFLLLTFLVCILPAVKSQTIYNQYFTDKCLRIDWMLSGNETTQNASIIGLRQQPIWGGPTHQLIDKLDYGMYKVVVTDFISHDTLYSQSFSTLFEEWQTTDEAHLLTRSFPQVTEVPFPKRSIKIDFWGRNKDLEYLPLLSFAVDPASNDINKEPVKQHDTRCLIKKGESSACVDIAFLAEGYQACEMAKFYKDVQVFADFLLTQAPYKQFADRFNIWAVGTESLDSGTDDPTQNIWRNTAFNSGFNTFQTDRYLETFDMPRIHDAAALVPHDHVVVMVNTSKYGGGGVYNFFSIMSADNDLSKIVFVHEFGHGFAGLGDEYYTSEVAYSDFVNQKKEPREPNLTTLVNFSKKWKDMVDPSTPIPTPATAEYKQKVGVFEGGGYVAKGVYRPALDCRMKTNEAPSHCPVCLRAIESVIRSLTE